MVIRRLIWGCTVCQRPTKWGQGLNELNITPRVLEITSRNFRKCKNLDKVGTEIVLTQMYVPHGECKVLLNMLKTFVNSSHIYILKQRHTIRFETLSNVERMVIDESPSSLSPLAVMQMDDDFFISMFKQW